MLPLRDSTSGQQRQTLLRTDIPVFYRALTRQSITKGTAKMNRKLNLRVQRGTKCRGAACFAHLPATPEHLLEKETQPRCPGEISTCQHRNQMLPSVPAAVNLPKCYVFIHPEKAAQSDRGTLRASTLVTEDVAHRGRDLGR